MPSRQNLRYAARLRKLDTYLRQLPDEQYYHDTFIKTENVASCNTVGCAMGHAVASRQFPGLKVRYNGPGLSRHETFTFGPFAGFEFEDWMHTMDAMSQWANHYFGPGTYSRIFDTAPYYSYKQGEHVKAGGGIKAAVRANMQRMITEFEGVAA